MDNIEVISLYEDSNKQRADKFISKTQSTLKVDIDKSKITRDVEWIDMMNFTVPYIDNIFRSPNRFIVNEEEIVKVDLKKSKLNDVVVKFNYSIRVTNEGEIAGYAKEVSDYIPNGLKFVAEDNPDWTEKDGKIGHGIHAVVVVDAAVRRKRDDMDPGCLHGVVRKLRMMTRCVRRRAFFA